MSRAPGKAPQFERLLTDLRRAQEAWQYGNIAKAEAILRMVGSIALSESKERGGTDPVPESDGDGQSKANLE